MMSKALIKRFPRRGGDIQTRMPSTQTNLRAKPARPTTVREMVREQETEASDWDAIRPACPFRRKMISKVISSNLGMIHLRTFFR